MKQNELNWNITFETNKKESETEKIILKQKHFDKKVIDTKIKQKVCEAEQYFET